jgi:hypothetical protein
VRGAKRFPWQGLKGWEGNGARPRNSNNVVLIILILIINIIIITLPLPTEQAPTGSRPMSLKRFQARPSFSCPTCHGFRDTVMRAS